MTSSVPRFGVGAVEELDNTFEFEIEAAHVATREPAVLAFQAYRDPGPGFAVEYATAQSDEDQARAATRLVGSIVVDHDGLSIDYIPPSPTPDNPDPEPDPRLADRDQWSSARRFFWLMRSTEYRAKTKVIGEIAEWVINHANERQGPVKGPAGKVPTAAPARSSRGRTTTRSGSTAKPRKRA
jgi:hypothetical protein